MKPVLAIVACNKHGMMNARNGEREVRVPIPQTKKISQSGCPMCAREKQ